MLPVIELSGTPLEQGRTHGRAARARIAHNLEVYFDRFEREGRVSRGEVLARASDLWPVVQARSADYAASVRGVAEGAGLDLMAVVALNVRYEILYHQFTANAMADACTVFAALPEATASGHLLMGQNWDWIPDVQGVVLHVAEPDLERLFFTEAGIVGGKVGLNSAGLGLAISGLTSTGDDWSRLGTPFHVRCYEILRAHELETATAIALDEDRSCSANFLIGHACGGVVDLETAPGATCRLTPERGMLAHTNHFLDPETLGIAEPPNPRRPGSINRLTEMRRLLGGPEPLTPEVLQRHLRDHTGHPDSVCRHPHADDPPEQHYETVTSVVMDLHDGAMWITDGPPCRSPYDALRLPGGGAAPGAA